MGFRNKFLKYYSNQAFGADQSGGPPASTPPASTPPASNPPASNPPAAAEIDYTKLAEAMLIAQQTQQTQPPTKGVFDQAKEQQEQALARTQEIEAMRHLVQFDQGFDNVLIENAALFSLTPAKIREFAVNLKDIELVKTLKIAAAKDFFSKTENATLLDEIEQIHVDQNINKMPEKFIDADKAWSLVDKAILIHKRIAQHSSITNNTGTGSVDAPNIEKYLKKCAGEIE